MGVTETSRESYRSLDKLGQRQRVVYKQIEIMEQRARTEKDLPSNADVARALGYPINSITPRSLELKKAGFVKVAGTKKDSVTGKSVQTLRTSSPDESRLVNILKQEAEQEDNWKPSAVSWLKD